MELAVRGGIVGLEDVSAVRQMDGGRIIALVVSIRAGHAEKAGGMSFVGSNGNAGARQPAAGTIFEGAEGPGFGHIFNCKLYRSGRVELCRRRKIFFDRIACYGVEVVQLQCEIARNSVESQRPSTVTGYAAATPLASGFLETALVRKAMSDGISR